MKAGSFDKYSLSSAYVNLVNGFPFPTMDISTDLSLTYPYYEADFEIAARACKIKVSWSAKDNLSKWVSRYVLADWDLAPIACVNGEECGKRENCKTFKFWQGLDNVINEYVDSKTLADLIK